MKPIARTLGAVAARRGSTRIANPDPPARPPNKPPAEPIRIKVPPPRVETPEEPCRPEDEPEIEDIKLPPEMPPPQPPEERVRGARASDSGCWPALGPPRSRRAVAGQALLGRAAVQQEAQS